MNSAALGAQQARTHLPGLVLMQLQWNYVECSFAVHGIKKKEVQIVMSSRFPHRN